MHGSVIPVLEFIKIDLSVLIDVKSPVGPFNQALSKLIHIADYDTNELVKIDLSASINIQGFEKTFYVLRVDIDSEVADSFCEFWQVQLARAIVVCNFELSL